MMMLNSKRVNLKKSLIFETDHYTTPKKVLNHSRKFWFTLTI